MVPNNNLTKILKQSQDERIRSLMQSYPVVNAISEYALVFSGIRVKAEYINEGLFLDFVSRESRGMPSNANNCELKIDGDINVYIKEIFSSMVDAIEEIESVDGKLYNDRIIKRNRMVYNFPSKEEFSIRKSVLQKTLRALDDSERYQNKSYSNRWIDKYQLSSAAIEPARKACLGWHLGYEKYIIAKQNAAMLKAKHVELAFNAGKFAISLGASVALGAPILI